MELISKLVDYFKPSRLVKCIDCGRLVPIDKESYFWWTEKYGHNNREQRDMLQCVDCAIKEGTGR